jgi:membrane peptidoglycan carboxypeptidase
VSTERRRSAGGRRRANGPADDARGNGGRRGARGPAEDERTAGRRRARDDDAGGFWDDERPQRRRSDAGREGGRSAARSEGGRGEGRRRADDGRRGGDNGSRAAAAESGRRSADGRRRPPEDGRRGPEGGRRAAAHGARAEGGRRAAGGGGRRRPPARGRRDHDEYDDRGPVRRFFAKAWKPALITFGVLFVLGVGGLAVAYITTDDPRTMDEQSEAVLAATSISFADGNEALTTGDINRVIITEDQLPQSVIDGVLAAEQRNFYEEPGISISGTMRAVLSAGSAGGGSTITQQMARNYYDGLSQERSYTRKLKEIMISIKAGQVMDPDQILTQYLNTIYFGRNAYGIQAAAQAYFNKNVEDLNHAEGAFLGGIIQQPGNFENVAPGSDMEDVLHERWEYVVKGLYLMNDEDPDLGLTRAEAEELEYPEVVEYEPGANLEGYNGYIRDAVINELAARYDLDATQVATQGFQVTTSLEKPLMDAADRAFDETLPDMPVETVYGLAAVEPATGEIKAFHGGDDFTSDPNNSLSTDAQAGSAFKPYVLAAGLEQDIGLNSVFDGDSPQEFEGIGEPIQNDSNRDWGPVDLIDSTKHSVNTSFVQLAIEATPQSVVDIAGKSGIPDRRFESAEMGPNIALGTYRVTPLDQASGFSTFANGGVHMPQHMITEVRDADGEVLPPNDADLLEKGTPAFSAETAADATYAMQQVTAEDGGGSEAALPDRPVAGKTGTSNEAKSAWFVGFTPQLSTAVGLSRTDGQQLEIPGVQDVYGGTTSARIWRAFMIEAMEGKEVQEFPEPVFKGQELNFGPTEEPSPPPEPEVSEEPSEPAEPSESPSMSPPATSESPELPEPPDGECNWLSDDWPECQEDDGPGGPGGPDGPDAQQNRLIGWGRETE